MITAATLGASAALPASAWTSEATTTACCVVSPCEGALARFTASPCLSNSATMVWRIWRSVSPADTKYVSGQVKPSFDT